MRTITVALLLGLCSAVPGCTPLRQANSSTTVKTFPCARRVIGFYQFPAEMVRVEGGCRGRAVCAGSLQNVETVEIAGYALQDWFWQGATAPTFSVVQQDSYRAQAQARAEAKRPVSKSTVSVVFFTDIIAHSQGTQHFLGRARPMETACPVPSTTDGVLRKVALGMGELRGGIRGAHRREAPLAAF